MTGPDSLRYGQTWPDLDGFRELAQGRRVIPVMRRLLADAETPVGVYRKLARNLPGTFLLESAEHGGVWSRYSIIGAASRAVLTERDGEAVWFGDPPAGIPTRGNPVEVLRDAIATLATEPIPGLPPLTGGMVGFIGYDAVRRWEKVPTTAPDELRLPELAMMLATDVAVLDHADGSLLLVANAVNFDDTDERVDDAWADAVARLDRMTAQLAEPADSTVAVLDPVDIQPRSNETREHYEQLVEEGKEAIRAGEVFQVVLSQRFSMPCTADALDVYRALRTANPSPYMYLVRLTTPDGRPFEIVGSSPEALVKVEGSKVITHPIAGSRPRGATPEDDVLYAKDLFEDPKERSEHVMLVDLSRNDLQRVCEPGSVEVVDLMSVHRYSHVMHLESTVVGRLAPGRTAYDVLAATFPAGTLSGAPKPRALQLIEEMEASRRGVYGGVIGYLDVHGDLDMAIAIRTAVLLDGVAHVQAGAGIVADSVPATEYEETVNKAAAVVRAVAAASGLRAP
ncbi:anthranilate synthase component 1 [Kineosphaera limosa]|uniref:Anthranilate synthase component 1 n=1 Tax=Kineosphaera limosa NBRC 100340 TaxID=1184609 RepID=K6WQL0_9MICO|nr:anthranilate synthase component I [Kineosphaera limosa]NYE03050.1 anthranilate synthase component 1 [Kineosphaera limosa]GAB94387.1 anthranilate synthase component I [Kineosphaera limosa NBRC 100340]